MHQFCIVPHFSTLSPCPDETPHFQRLRRTRNMSLLFCVVVQVFVSGYIASKHELHRLRLRLSLAPRVVKVAACDACTRVKRCVRGE